MKRNSSLCFLVSIGSLRTARGVSGGRIAARRKQIANKLAVHAVFRKRNVVARRPDGRTPDRPDLLIAYRADYRTLQLLGGMSGEGSARLWEAAPIRGPSLGRRECHRRGAIETGVCRNGRVVLCGAPHGALGDSSFRARSARTRADMEPRLRASDRVSAQGAHRRPRALESLLR